jgi:hypothetical protein
LPNSGVSLPYPYFVGDYKADSFEDITSKNVMYLAQVVGPTARTRRIHGVVNGSTGAKVSGTPGWTSSRTATGTYEIVFDSQFADAPTAQVTAVTGVANGLATPSQLDVTTFSVGGTASDQSFNWSVEL